MSSAYEVFVIKPGERGVLPAVSHDSFATFVDAHRFANTAPFKGFGIKMYKTRRNANGKLLKSKLLLRR